MHLRFPRIGKNEMSHFIDSIISIIFQDFRSVNLFKRAVKGGESCIPSCSLCARKSKHRFKISLDRVADLLGNKRN